jgi:hypothetical protein
MGPSRAFSGKAMSQRHTNIICGIGVRRAGPPRDVLLDPGPVVRGTTEPDVDGAHEPADSCSALAKVLGRLLACSAAMSRLSAVCRLN